MITCLYKLRLTAPDYCLYILLMLKLITLAAFDFIRNSNYPMTVLKMTTVWLKFLRVETLDDMDFI